MFIVYGIRDTMPITQKTHEHKKNTKIQATKVNIYESNQNHTKGKTA